MKPDRINLFNECTGFSKGEFDENICSLLLEDYHTEFEVLYKALKQLHDLGLYKGYNKLDTLVDSENINLIIKDKLELDTDLFVEHKKFIYRIQLDNSSENTTVISIANNIVE